MLSFTYSLIFRLRYASQKTEAIIPLKDPITCTSCSSQLQRQCPHIHQSMLRCSLQISSAKLYIANIKSFYIELLQAGCFPPHLSVHSSGELYDCLCIRVRHDRGTCRKCFQRGDTSTLQNTQIRCKNDQHLFITHSSNASLTQGKGSKITSAAPKMSMYSANGR